jgi:hypothetical protein
MAEEKDDLEKFLNNVDEISELNLCGSKGPHV